MFCRIRDRVLSLCRNEDKLISCLWAGLMEMSFSRSFKILLALHPSWPLQEELCLQNVSLLLQQMDCKVNVVISIWIIRLGEASQMELWAGTLFNVSGLHAGKKTALLHVFITSSCFQVCCRLMSRGESLFFVLLAYVPFLSWDDRRRLVFQKAHLDLIFALRISGAVYAFHFRWSFMRMKNIVFAL